MIPLVALGEKLKTKAPSHRPDSSFRFATLRMTRDSRVLVILIPF